MVADRTAPREVDRAALDRYREVFAAEYESTGYVLWSPISDPGLTFPEDADMDAVLAACPESPPDDVLYD